MASNRTPTSTLNLLILCGLVVLFSLFSTHLPAFAENHAADIDIEAIVKQMDELYRSETSQTNMEMQIVTPHWERTLALEVWTQGMDRTFILINVAQKGEGRCYLTDWERNVELSPQDQQGDESATVNDDGILDGFRFNE